jgi:hypothetical protein
MNPDIHHAVGISWGHSTKDATGVFQTGGVDAHKYIVLEKYKWLGVVGLRRLRHPLPAGGSLSTPADPSASGVSELHREWQSDWFVRQMVFDLAVRIRA